MLLNQTSSMARITLSRNFELYKMLAAIALSFELGSHHA